MDPSELPDFSSAKTNKPTGGKPRPGNKTADANDRKYTRLGGLVGAVTAISVVQVLAPILFGPKQGFSFSQLALAGVAGAVMGGLGSLIGSYIDSRNRPAK